MTFSLKKLVVSSVALCAVLLPLSGSAQAAETMTLRADSWCPYNCDPKSDKPGYVVEMAKAIFEGKGVTVDYQVEPWTRALDAVRAGTYHGAIGAARGDAPDLVFPSLPIGMNEFTLAVPKGKAFKWEGVASLKGKKLGAIQGYDYDPEINDYIKANKDGVDLITGDDAVEKNIRKLAAGRTDAFLENAAVVKYTAAQLGMADKFDYVDLGKKDPLFIGFTPAKPEGKKYAEMLQAGVKELRESGKLKAILEKYGQSDWQ